MRLTKIPRYSAAELERRAEELLRSRCGWPPAIPVDIEALVDQEPGVVLDILPGLKEICGVAGLARYESRTDTMRLIMMPRWQTTHRAASIGSQWLRSLPMYSCIGAS